MATLIQQKHTSIDKHAELKSHDQGSQATSTSARDRIQTRAYEIFQHRKRNGHQGDQVSDWLQAEREIAGSHSTAGGKIESKAQPVQHEVGVKR